MLDFQVNTVTFGATIGAKDALEQRYHELLNTSMKHKANQVLQRTIIKIPGTPMANCPTHHGQLCFRYFRFESKIYEDLVVCEKIEWRE